jgi:hypothetical protein
MKKVRDILSEAMSPESRKAHGRMFKAAAKKKHDADKKAAAQAEREKRLKAKGWVRNNRGGMSKVETAVEVKEGRNDVVKALADKAKTGGIDKADFKKAHDLYKAAKLEDLKKLIKGLDTDVAEYIADVISRHDSKAFNSMYPRAKSGDSMAKIVRERMDRNSGADGHSDGQSDSSRDRKLQDKDYDNLIDLYDADDEKVYRELINLYGYKPKIAQKTLMRNNPDIKKITDRGAGVKIDMREDAQDEKRMMRSQLMFMAYAAKEIATYLDRINDPEEWYQNKMATTHSMMKTLYSYAQGQMQAMAADRDDIMAGYYGEDTNMKSFKSHLDENNFKIDGRRREFKEKLRKLAYEKYGKKKVDAIDKADMKEDQQIDLDEVKLSELSPALLKRYQDKAIKQFKQSDKKRNDPGYTDAKRKEHDKRATKRWKGSQSAAQKFKDRGGYKAEEVQPIEEANFKPGNLKLKDGKTVKLSMDDAKAISAVMKTLNPKNRKEMETRMMADKKGFDEIMAFVQAAGL